MNMTFYQFWQILQEDGDLNAFSTGGDGLSPQTQYLNYNPDVDFNKGLNLKRRVNSRLKKGPQKIKPVSFFSS
jgi:hypothetical protein